MILVTGSGKRVASKDTPVMIRLTAEEKSHIANMPEGEDVFVVLPPHWQDHHSKRWVNANKTLLSDEKKEPPTPQVESTPTPAAPAVVESEPPNAEQATAVSDDDILSLISPEAKENNPAPTKNPTVEPAKAVISPVPPSGVVEAVRDEKSVATTEAVSDEDILNILGLPVESPSQGNREEVIVKANFNEKE